MKSIAHCWLMIAVAASGANTAGAANSESRTVEKHVVVSSDAGKAMPVMPREPVTYLGVAVMPVEGALASQLQLGEGEGLVVSFVESDSPAAEAGLKQHDVLTKLDDQILIEPRQLSVLVRNHREGDTVAIAYLRAGKPEKTNVTLAQHEPARPNSFQWFGQGAPEMIFRAESMGSSGDMDVHRIERTPGGNFTLRAPPPIDVMPRSGASGDRVMIFRPQTNVVFSDEGGTLILSADENERQLTAKNAAGEIIFEGPIDTPDQREQLPEELRQRLEKLEQLDVMKPPPPVPPALPRSTGIAPAIGVGRARGVI